MKCILLLLAEKSPHFPISVGHHVVIVLLPDTQPHCLSSSTGNNEKAQAENFSVVPEAFGLRQVGQPGSVRETRHIDALTTPPLAQKVLGRPAEVGGG